VATSIAVLGEQGQRAVVMGEIVEGSGAVALS